MRKIFLYASVLLLTALPLAGQNVKTVTVGDGQSFTDHISLAEDARDMDIMIKFIFDEPNNTLTVSVLSYRRLFVFREPARYHSVVRCRRLHPERLPYVVESDKDARYYLSKGLKKSLPRPLSRHVFQRWIEYEGLQPRPTDYKMVNDFIEQVFDIQGKRSVVTITLRDIFLLDENKPESYILSAGRDLNTKYQVTILRNPCLGMEEEVAAVRKACQDVQKAYEGFCKNYPNGEAASEEAVKNFEETKKVLLTQYAARDAQSSCPDLQQALEQYNAYVDSIGQFTCKLVKPGDLVYADGLPLDVKLLYTQTRQLDKSVARWLVTKDELEKKDLVSQCKEIISDMSAMIRQHTAATAEEKQAVQAYQEAEQYFRKTCKP